MKLKYKILALLTIIGVIGFTLALSSIPVATVTVTEDGWFNGVMSVYKNDELIFMGHNTLTNLGKNSIRDNLCHNTGNNITYLSVGNGTDPAAGDVILNNEITTCGFYRAEVKGANVTDVATGNWSFEFTFASACNNIVVNTSGMSNASAGNMMHWGDNFTSTTLQSGDTLKITWNISVGP